MPLPSSARAALTLILIGSLLQFFLGLVLVGVGLHVLGFVGSKPETAQWVGWTEIAIGAIAVAGGEIGLQAYGKGRRGDLRAARIRGLVAAFVPPIQLLTLIGALLCRGEESADRTTSASAEQDPLPR